LSAVGVALRRFCLALALAAAASPAAAQTAAERVAEILAAEPDGSRSEQAAWLYAEARRQSDAHLAARLMTEVVRRGEGTAQQEARLWLARFHLAAGETDQAAAALAPLGTLPADAPGGAEAAYWRLLTGRQATAPEIGPLRSPPWELWAQLASLHGPLREREAVRFALGLEGSVRRWGLLGPWLWRLQQGGSEALRGVADEIVRQAGAALAGAPERAALLAERAVPAAGVTPVRPVAAAAPARDRGTARHFAVEIGTYAEREVAETLVRELGTHGFPAFVAAPSTEAEPGLVRVLVGPCARIAEAESLGVALAERWMFAYRIVEAP
jgi:hypothetical protein